MLRNIPLFLILLNCPLSVFTQNVLNYFNASPVENNILLEWQMTQGQTCDGIKILHSTDSIVFDEIGFIGGLCGSKIETVNYQFTHKDPQLNSNHYYRLEFGNVGPSETVTVLLLDYSNGYIIRPHPASNHSLLYFKPTSPHYFLWVYQNNGQILYKSETDQNYFELSSFKIPNGNHIFEIIDGRGVRITSGKMIILNE